VTGVTYFWFAIMGAADHKLRGVARSRDQRA